MQVSIIIVNWNTHKLVLDCLTSIYANPPSVSYDIWVVDNASTDGSVQAIRLNFPEVKLIECSENLGFAKGNNLALTRSASKYALLLNSDTIVKPGALQHLYEFMEMNPNAGAAGPLLLNSDESPQPSCYPFPSLSRELWRLFHLDLLYHYSDYAVPGCDMGKPYPVDVIQGACLILRREALDQVGLLDPSYFMYTEDVDLCYRIKKNGWSLYWLPDAKIIHFGQQSTRQVAPQMFISLYETKVRFFRKHYGVMPTQVYKLILLCASIARLFFFPLACLQKSTARSQNYYLAKRYLDLLSYLLKM